MWVCELDNMMAPETIASLQMPDQKGSLVNGSSVTVHSDVDSINAYRLMLTELSGQKSKHRLQLPHLFYFYFRRMDLYFCVLLFTMSVPE